MARSVEEDEQVHPRELARVKDRAVKEWVVRVDVRPVYANGEAGNYVLSRWLDTTMSFERADEITQEVVKLYHDSVKVEAERDDATWAGGIHRWEHSDEDSVNGSIPPGEPCG